MAGAKRVRSSLTTAEEQKVASETLQPQNAKQLGTENITATGGNNIPQELDNRKEQMAELMESYQVARELDTIVEENSSTGYKSSISTDDATTIKPTDHSNKYTNTNTVDTNDPFTDTKDLKKAVTVYSDLMNRRIQEIGTLRTTQSSLQAKIRNLMATIEEKDTLIAKFKKNQAILEKVVFECRAAERGSLAHVTEMKEETTRQVKQVREDAALSIEEVKKAALVSIEQVKAEALGRAEGLTEGSSDVVVLKEEIAGLRESFKKLEVELKEEVGQLRNVFLGFANSSSRGGQSD